MSQFLQGKTPESFSWLNAWGNAITRPNVKVYQELVNDPQACTRRAFIYVALSATIGFVIASLLQSIITAFDMNEFDLSIPAYSFSSTVMFGLPFAIVAGILALALGAGILQRIACLLGGTGGFSKLAYAFACIAAPIGMVVGIFSSGPVILEVVLPLLLYASLLQVIAVKVVNNFHWSKAILTMLIPLAILTAVAGAVVAMLA